MVIGIPFHYFSLPYIFMYLFQATVAYYLLYDNRSMASSGYLGAEFQESVVCPLLFLLHSLFLSA